MWRAFTRLVPAAPSSTRRRWTLLVDAERYRTLFVQEARDHLAALTQGLDSRDAAHEPSVIDGLFRAAHSFKGMAATLGYTDEADLADAIEDHLSTARDHGSLADELRHRLVVATDLLSECVDCVEAGSDRPDLGREIETLRGLAAQAIPAPFALDWSALCATAADVAPERLRVVQVRLDEGCAAPRARLLVLRRMLATAGTIVAEQPEPSDATPPPGSDHVLLLDSEEPADRLDARIGGLPDIARHEVTVTVPAAAPEPARRDAGPTPSSGPAEPTPTSTRPSVLPRTIRVPLAQVDNMLDQAAELRIAYSRLEQRLDEIFVGGRPYRLAEALEHLLREAKGIHDTALDLRTLPARVITDRFPRLVRSLSDRLDKDVRLEIEGEDVQADRSVLDALVDPLTHLIKNALDHGLETPEERGAVGKPAQGVVRVTFVRDPLGLRVTLADDGRGIPREAAVQKAVARGLVDPEDVPHLDDEQVFRLLSTPGFSTATEVTDVSGRGVGLDAVKEQLERVGGSMRIASQPGRGTSVTLELPPSLSLQEALNIEVDGEPYYIPVESILTVVPLGPETILHGWVSVLDPDVQVAESTAPATQGVEATAAALRDAAADTKKADAPTTPGAARDAEEPPSDPHPTIDVRIVDLAALLDLPPQRHRASTEDHDLKVERLKERLRGEPRERSGRGRRPSRRSLEEAGPVAPVGIVVERHGERACLLVERVGIIREIVVKSVDTVAARSRHIAGATVQGDGRVGLILDVPSIVLSPPARPVAAR